MNVLIGSWRHSLAATVMAAMLAPAPARADQEGDPAMSIAGYLQYDRRFGCHRRAKLGRRRLDVKAADRRRRWLAVRGNGGGDGE